MWPCGLAGRPLSGSGRSLLCSLQYSCTSRLRNPHQNSKECENTCCHSRIQGTQEIFLSFLWMTPNLNFSSLAPNLLPNSPSVYPGIRLLNFRIGVAEDNCTVRPGLDQVTPSFLLPSFRHERVTGVNHSRKTGPELLKSFHVPITGLV